MCALVFNPPQSIHRLRALRAVRQIHTGTGRACASAVQHRHKSGRVRSLLARAFWRSFSAHLRRPSNRQLNRRVEIVLSDDLGAITPR